MHPDILLGYLPWVVILAATFSWAASFLSLKIALRYDAMDKPGGGRKIHTHPMPLFGGLGIGGVIAIGLLLFLLISGLTSWFGSRSVASPQIVGFAAALLVLMLGGALDDRLDLSPKWQILFPLLAALLVIGTGTTIGQITDWFARGGYSLLWGRVAIGPFAFSWPADIITLLWLLSVTYATKLLDGLDGLVTGQVVIGAGIIGALALTTAYFQPEVAVLAALIGGAYLGFLPRNMFPAKQFLGEAGSTIAGFSLGFLAILGGAKLATAFMVLGLPLIDAVLVVGGRILRGASPFVGDNTHLHFKLLQAGLSQRKAVIFLWTLAFLFGMAALGLQTPGKILLALTLFALMILLSGLTRTMQKEGATPKDMV